MTTHNRSIDTLAEALFAHHYLILPKSPGYKRSSRTKNIRTCKVAAELTDMPPKRTAHSGAGKPSFQVGPGSDASDDDKSMVILPPNKAETGVASAASSSTPTSAAQRKSQVVHKLPHFTRLPEKGADEESEDEELRWQRYKSGPTTPNIAESAQQLRRSLSVSGLAQLANNPDGGIKRKIWRPENEETKEPGDWERLAVHVFRGGFRAATVAFGLRGSVMLVFALIRLLRTR